MRCILLFSVLFYLLSCSQGSDSKKSSADTERRFVLKETIAKGDTGMITFGRFKPLNITYDLCQQWYLLDEDDGSTRDLMYEPKTNNRLFQEIMLYRDSMVMFNPRNGMKLGRWRLGQDEDKLLLIFYFDDGSVQEYIILDKTSRNLSLVWRNADHQYAMKLSSDAKVHANMLNDPFHPSNNKWRIRSRTSEKDSAIRNRIKECIKFYALYFRDHIKRKRTEINFAGLPSCFLWYRRGIGLYNSDELPTAWKDCFYSTEEAMKGLKMIKDLFNKYDFDWPKKTPSWFYETHSVLEQMWGKL